MYNMDYSGLGKRIKEERLNRGLTQAKLAEAADISTTYMGQIERGEKSLTLGTLVKLANYFNVSLDSLVRDSLRSYRPEDNKDWEQILAGRTNKEKQMIVDIVGIIDKYTE